jgi:hypothetical protein
MLLFLKYFRRKSVKIVEIRDHNIDPCAWGGSLKIMAEEAKRQK